MEKDSNDTNFREKNDGEKQVDECTKKFQEMANDKTAVNIMRRGQSEKLKKAEQQHKKVLKNQERKRMRYSMSRRLGKDREEKILWGIGNTIKVPEYFKRKK